MATVTETPRVTTIALSVPDWQTHRPGQHVDVRLTAEDGYQAQRSYSIASAPEDEHLMLTTRETLLVLRRRAKRDEQIDPDFADRREARDRMPE